MSNNFYVYAYLDPRKPGKYKYLNSKISFNFEPFYIGKGTRTRFYDHINEAHRNQKYKNHFKSSKILKIIKETGDIPFIIFIKKSITNSSAQRLEKVLISKIGRKDKKNGPLVNLTDGGEGCSGRIVTQKVIENSRKMGLQMKGEKNPMFKKTIYECWVQKYGKKIADEKMVLYKNNMSKALQAKPHDPGNKTKLSEEQLHQILDLAKNNNSIIKIANATKLSTKIVWNRMKAFRKKGLLPLSIKSGPKPKTGAQKIYKKAR